MTALLLTLMLFGSGLLMAVLGMPMALGRVRRNSLYGFRTRKTLSSDHVWFLANRYSGRALVSAGLMMMVAAVPFFFIASLLGPTIAAWVMLAVLAVPMAWMVVKSFRYLARL